VLDNVCIEIGAVGGVVEGAEYGLPCGVKAYIVQLFPWQTIKQKELKRK